MFLRQLFQIRVTCEKCNTTKTRYIEGDFVQDGLFLVYFDDDLKICNCDYGTLVKVDGNFEVRDVMFITPAPRKNKREVEGGPELLSVEVICPICQETGNIFVPKSLISGLRFKFVGVFVRANILCRDKFIVFLDSNGKPIHYETARLNSPSFVRALRQANMRVILAKMLRGFACNEIS